MPPKGSKKAAVAPATPKAGSDDEVPPTPATEVKKTPRKRAPAKQFNKLSTALSGAAPVDVAFENDTVHGKPLAKEGGFAQTIKLVAPQQFELVASYMLDNGLQAIVIKPSAPFPFLKLPRHLRTRVIQYCLTPSTNKGRIEITDSKSGGARAKDYLKEFKHRTAVAVLNKQLAAEARLILYAFRLRFDTTTTALNFLSMISTEARKAMVAITIAGYVKATAMPCMTLLADCSNLTKINIISGVGVNTTPQKAAKAFFTESGRLLQAIVHNAGGDKDAALNVVTFGKGCLTIKEEDEIVAWDDDQNETFVDLIAEKLK
ncbi:hypothetical protein E4T52_06331 [Aureobasidium sp. EXF-3400]|nr:hypothetical protein E4T51_05419 [Aureobasidium sp. EXF-12344]KAI4778751.1 hypothetical protein E4T52_06331 [Aureobasidium sp. EXF-3400]